MQLRIIDPPTMDKRLTKSDAVAAVRHSFAVVRARGQTIVHRNQLNNTIDAWLIANGFLSPTSSGQEEGDWNHLHEVLGTGESSTVSFVRAGLLLKAGPWYCPHPARALLLGEAAGDQIVGVLSALPAGFLSRAEPNGDAIHLEEAGLAYLARLSGGACPWPIVDPFQVVDLKPVDTSVTPAEAALKFLSSELSREAATGSPTLVRGKTELTRLPQREMNDRVRIFSVGRWDSVSSVHARPPRLWGSLEVHPNVHAFFGQSSYDELNPDNQVWRKVVVLMTPNQGSAGPAARIVQVHLDPFLTGRVEWAFRAALGEQVLVDARAAEDGWVILDFHGVVPTGPLRTWLALFGHTTGTKGASEEWMLRTEAREMTSSVLTQYFAKTQGITT